MPVSATYRPNSYTGNAVATVFAYSFRIIDQTHITVQIDGVTKTLGADYSVSGVGNNGGGNITFAAAPALGTQVVLSRSVPYSRTIDYVENGDFTAATVDNDEDIQTMLIQQVLERTERVPSLAIGTTIPTPLVLPEPVSGGEFIRWNAGKTALEVASIASPGALVVSTYIATLLDDATAAEARATLGMDDLGYAFRNRIINGNMQIAQRATSATVTAGTGVPTASAGYPCVDRWYVYSTGANVTAAQVAGAGATLNRLQITGAASVTAVGVGQRIEAANSADLAGQTVTLSVDLANSLLTTVTWTANYATTTDAFGTVGAATKTQIATGTFTVSSAVARFSTTIAIPAAATTGIEILFTVGAQVSGTWTIGNVQIERGTSGIFDPRPYGQELALCQRYLPAFKSSNTNDHFGNGVAVSTTAARIQFQYRTPPRAVPTGVTVSSAAHFAVGGIACTAIALNNAGLHVARLGMDVAAGLTNNAAYEGSASSASGSLLFTGCEVP